MSLISSAQGDDRGLAALRALLLVIDINPANLHKLVNDLPETFVSKTLLKYAFNNKAPKDYPATLLASLSDKSEQSVD
jgi:hypothetical protein